MEKDKHIPSLEHSRLLIQERINYLETYTAHLRLCHLNPSQIIDLEYKNKELAGHEQGLKALDSHYALIEAIKGAIIIQDLWLPAEVSEEHEGEGQALNKMRNTFLELIKQCEG